jgi:hypothetical protein
MLLQGTIWFPTTTTNNYNNKNIKTTIVGMYGKALVFCINNIHNEEHNAPKGDDRKKLKTKFKSADSL